MAALATLILCSCAQRGIAWADEVPADVPRNAVGACHIGSTWMVGEQSFFTIPSFSGLLADARPSSAFECLNHTAAAPEHVDATYEARLNGCSLEGGWVEYYVTITPPDATDGVTRNELGLTGYQRVGGTVRLAWDFKGGIELAKRSANEMLTDGNACYSLQGAVYGVFATEEDAATHDGARSLRKLATDADGTWKTGMDFTIGTYYVAEISAPRGYALDETVYPVTVEPNAIARAGDAAGYVEDAPQHNPVTLWASKSDAETADGSAQGAGTLEGTQFTVRYFDGYYDAESLPAEATRTWVVATDADGRAVVSDEGKVSGDEFYRTAGGAITIPLGTVAVSETRAPEGYRADDGAARVFQITDGGTRELVDAYAAPAFSDHVMRGGVAIGKTDRQTGGRTPQGAATFAGTTFAIVTTNAQPVLVDGIRYTTGMVVAEIVAEGAGDGSATAATNSSCLPFGTYIAYESESSEGYLYDGASQSWSREFEISADGQVVDLTGAGQAPSNRVVRGDFSFSKVDGFTAERLAFVPFMVESQTTGERHVVVTDENGMLSTAAGWNAHTVRTNANDAAVIEVEGGFEVDERLLDPRAGVWFSGRADTACPPDDGLGALPYDTYTVSELHAPGSEGYELVTFAVRVTRDGCELDLGTVDDNAGPIVATSLADDNGVKLVAAGGVGTVTDTIGYANLDMRDEYTMIGTMHLVNDDGTDGGVVAEGSTTFRPTGSSGLIDVEFAVDTEGLEGRRLVAFERVVDANGTVQAAHEDLAYEGQTVRVPAIGTTLVDAADGDHEAEPADEVTLVDTVSYRGLTPGDTYTLTGTLHVVGVDGEDGGAALDGRGREIVARKTFTAEESEGAVEVAFTFSASALADTTVVAFEELERRGQVYATHADIADEGQTVRFGPQPPEETLPEPEPEKPAPVPDEPAKEPVPEEGPQEEPAPAPAPEPDKAPRIAKTGDTLPGILLLFIPTGALGLALAALSVRRLQCEAEMTIERAKPRGGRKL